jgi:hypothetical protein
MRRVTNGMLLVAIGLVHQVFGLAVGRHILVAIARDGVVGAIEPDPLRSIFFWYFFLGLVVLVLGGLLHQLEREGRRATRALGWQLGALGLAGGALIPASGFWALLPVAWRILRARP